MAKAKTNDSVKAFTRWMAENIRKEWEMACNTNPHRGTVYDQSYFLARFDRDGDDCGASKAVHLLEYIVVKRHQYRGYVPEKRNQFATGNQLIDEINCWQRFAQLPEADLLCPVLKYFTSKSDKVSATCETMQRNVVIIAQKAVYVSDALSACKKAERLNRENGCLTGESAHRRFEKLRRFSESQNWRDALYNGGNSGVIYDYDLKCYKAVFIDYAL